MRVTVKRLADMWRGAAEAETNTDKADQLRKCADDLEKTKFHHELVLDPVSKLKFFRLR